MRLTACWMELRLRAVIPRDLSREALSMIREPGGGKGERDFLGREGFLDIGLFDLDILDFLLGGMG